MNSQDFHEGMVRNMEWSVKKQAQLDAIYERERTRYNGTSQCQSVKQSYKPFNDNNINSRLDNIERKIDRLYEMISDVKQEIKYSKDGMFVVAPDNANIIANQTITLTDQQFKMFVKKLVTD